CRRGIRHVVVVTSPTHTRRARLILRQALGPRIQLSVRPTSDALFPANQWWRRRRAIKDVLIEYQKFVVYWLVERWTIEPCGGLKPRERRTGSARLDGLADQRRQLALGGHLAGDVAAPHEFSPGEELANRGPARVRLDPFALVRLGENVDRLERHADLVERLDRGGGE